MDAHEYLSGGYPTAIVPDLVLQGAGQVELVLILESPHSDELLCSTPVAGRAGHSALQYLLSPAVTTATLGSFIKDKHAAGDPRVAILNVSRVPLQRSAFKRVRPPVLSPTEWELLKKIRKSKARSLSGTSKTATHHVGSKLLYELQAHFDTLPMSTTGVVVTCGVFAGRFGRELHGLPGGSPHEVRHPSYNWWFRSTGQQAAKLGVVKQLFAQHT